MDCLHNAMVETDDPEFAWKCADCGYVYGKENPTYGPQTRTGYLFRQAQAGQATHAEMCELAKIVKVNTYGVYPQNDINRK